MTLSQKYTHYVMTDNIPGHENNWAMKWLSWAEQLIKLVQSRGEDKNQQKNQNWKWWVIMMSEK